MTSIIGLKTIDCSNNPSKGIENEYNLYIVISSKCVCQ